MRKFRNANIELKMYEKITILDSELKINASLLIYVKFL